MKRIGITQRVTETNFKERRDVLDQNWHKLAKKLNYYFIPLPNIGKDIKDYVKYYNIEGIILSGGNNVGISKGVLLKSNNLSVDDVALERDITEKELINLVITNKIPLLGVCRGMQFIHCFFGGKLITVDNKMHVAKKHEIIITDKNMRKFYSNKTNVNSYHNYGIKTDEIASSLLSTSYTGNETESLKHSKLPIYGLMWHPERENPYKKSDINFINSIFN